MSDNKEVSGQKDADLAAETRPVPSQAEGDRETVEEDLAEKDDASQKQSADKT